MGFHQYTEKPFVVFKQKKYLGNSGESKAASFLIDNGYKILAKNYRTKLGEIDIIAIDKDTICFVEVKTRSTDKFGLPQEAILDNKKRRIAKTALLFLKEKKLLDKKARFDVIAITFQKDLPKIDLIQNAFELDAKYTY